MFLGSGANGDVAIKRLKITASAAAHREMKIGRELASRQLDHVVPILDYGQDAGSDRYYLVMPVCDFSLQDYLSKRGVLDWEEAKPIALDIIAGLTEVGDIVHRDLKPGNVLWHQDKWQIADFGIAKFVEDSTSLETLRGSLTPPYAAPEQWKNEAPTRATDVYALACILHAMINGKPPFYGDLESVRRAHLETAPPSLASAPPRLNSLVLHMLRKNKNTRPLLERCAKVLESIEVEVSKPANAALAEAGQKIAREEAEAESRQRIIEAERLERYAMGEEAIHDLDRMMSQVFDQIENSSESVNRNKNSISLGPAQLTYTPPEIVASKSNESGNRHGTKWDVVAFSTVSIQAEVERNSAVDAPSYTFSATLCFTKTDKDDEFRWREISFWAFRSDNSHTPFAVHPLSREFWVATSNVVGGINIAHGPLTIDAEDEEDFQRRWLTLFAKGAQKRLRHPMEMPPPSRFFEE